MTTLLSLVLLIFVAYIGSIFYQRLRINALWMKSFAYSGSVYLLLGYLIGPSSLKIVTMDILDQLKVLFALVLGWAGFLIGLQVNIRALKRFQISYYKFATLNFIIALLLTYFALLYSFEQIFHITDKNEIFILSLATAVTSPIIIGVVSRERKLSGRLSHLLQFSAGYDNILGIIIVGIFAAVVCDTTLIGGFHPGVLLILVSAAIGLIAAYLYQLLSKELKTEEENFLLLLGLMIFIVGIALYLSQSLLFISFVFGAGLANRKMDTKKLFLNIEKIEKPLYILLLIYVGAKLDLTDPVYIALLTIFLAVNVLTKLLSGVMANYTLNKHSRLKKSIGLANLGMGGLSLALILDFHLINSSEYTPILLFVLTISIILNDLFSMIYLDKITVKN
ncbi:MAG: cation:proton antiporter [Calditrichaceae bacterium]